MGVYAGPEITSDGLVLALDAGNSKGFDDDENLLAYSEDFSNAYWTKSNVSVTANAIASPTGSSNASKLVESASTAVHELFRSDGALGVGSDTYITFSIFAKAAERQYCYIRSSGNSKRIAVVVDLSNGTFNVTNWGFTLNSSATVTPYPNGWYRITATAQSNYPTAPGWNGIFIVSPLDSYQLASNVGGGGYSYAGNGTSGIYIWGAHYEFGPGISNYYPTTGTAKNRGTTLIDMTGRGNSGTLTNGPTYSSANGGSIVFDGTNDYISCGNILNFTTENFSFNIFFYHTSTTTNQAGQGPILFYKGAFNTNGYYIQLTQTNPSQAVFITNQSGVNQLTVSSSSLVVGSWNNVSVTRSGSSVRIYINGVDATSSAGTHINPASSTDNFQLAAYSTGIFANTRIASFQAYNRALSAAEIQQNFNATRGRFGI